MKFCSIHKLLGTLRRGASSLMLSALVLPGISMAQELAFLEESAITEPSFLERSVDIALADVGVNEPIRLQGRETTRGVAFSIRADEVITDARLRLRLAYSPNMDPSRSQFSVMLNGEMIHSMLLDPVDGTTDTIDVDISPYVFLPDNDLVFSLQAARIDNEMSCANPADDSVWAQISNSTTLMINASRIGVKSDLANLPLPFFDPRDATELSLPVVFPGKPSLASIEAAAVIASHWGNLASYRGARFPVHVGELPASHAIVLATKGTRVGGLGFERISGPTIEIMDNPEVPGGKLLIVAGRTSKEMLTAARALALGDHLLSGQRAVVAEPIMSARKPYDAPNWIPTDRPVSLGELANAGLLEGHGISPGILGVNFQMAPDIFLWSRKGIPLDLRYRFPGAQWLNLDRSRLDVLINNKYINSVELSAEQNQPVGERLLSADYEMNHARVVLPPHLVFGQNTLQFYYDLHPAVDDPCEASLPAELRTGIDATTTLDLSGVHHFAKMPNLAFMAQAGFPFSRMADLSETAFVVSDSVDPQEVSALLTVVGNIGSKTGYPATGLKVVSAHDVNSVADRDLIVLGTLANQPVFSKWGESSPLIVEGNTAAVRRGVESNGTMSRFYSLLTGESSTDLLRLPVSSMTGILASFESPLASNKTVVALMGAAASDLVTLADSLRSPKTGALIQGDLVVVKGGGIESHVVSDEYYIGELPVHVWVQWFLGLRPWLVSVLMFLGLALVVFAAMRLMHYRAVRRGLELE